MNVRIIVPLEESFLDSFRTARSMISVEKYVYSPTVVVPIFFDTEAVNLIYRAV